jgi:hypothetical protein
MSRELRRVDLSFKWPLNKVWRGFINEHLHLRMECQECQGTGYSELAKELHQKWYDANGETEPTHQGGILFKNALQYNLNESDIQALIDANRLWDFTRVPRTKEQKKIVEEQIKNGKNSWLPFDNGYIPTPAEVNQWAKQGMGHDAYNCWVVIKSRCEQAGEEATCHRCSGEGYTWPSQTDKENYDNWQPTPPPEGLGFQLWETVSEGSPVSPVFETLDELCAYCEKNCSTFGSNRVSKEKWKQMLEQNFVHHTQGTITFI